jgi:hypothetical protein
MKQGWYVGEGGEIGGFDFKCSSLRDQLTSCHPKRRLAITSWANCYVLFKGSLAKYLGENLQLICEGEPSEDCLAENQCSASQKDSQLPKSPFGCFLE